jgi:glycosyltransferase involved in cell wall biosynthesis
MIGLDPTILGRGTGPGDTRERHVKYAAALRRHVPGGRLDVIVRVPRSWSGGATEIADGLVVHPVPCARAGFAPGALRACAMLTARDRPDVVTTQTPFDDGLVGAWLKRRCRAALNVQMHSSFLDSPQWMRHRPLVYRAFNRLGKWVAGQADTIRVVSRGEQRRLEQCLPWLKQKLVFLHELVDRATFEAPMRPEEQSAAELVLRTHGLAGFPLLLFVGRLSWEKNVAMLLEAFARAAGRVPGSALIVAGDGPLRASLERRAGALGLARRVVWLGVVPLPALRPWFAAAAGLLLPSAYEGFRKVVVESYLMGTPAIVTPFVSAAELVCDGETGFVAPDFHGVPWLGERMAYLLGHPEEARAMGQRGRTHVQSYLLPEREYMDRLVGIWQDTLARARREG